MGGSAGVSVILPTYNEREALELLYPALTPFVEAVGGEVIIVDDSSPDGTASFARTLSTARVPCTVIERRGVRGLASAVLAGVAKAAGEILVVMDADGSHPPELVPTMVGAVTTGGAEMALASRWVTGGLAPGLTLRRRAISSTARWLARPLTRVTDPMSGFFAVRAAVLGRAKLAPLGYKIALEVLVKCRPNPLVEIPFVFQPRLAGESKLGGAVARHYVQHIARLYAFALAPGRRASSTR
ncbi:MAG: polyprenol monophosphomannose synthase [Thermoplasmata archaeon]|nr:polyprenol monophosphomannose synthase [Thermoplasmata archaeon]